jgi:2-C-methyl-D-erythritol 4-phosphate cytidylyltransferase/2-C-methyl-D-erythritol 2,4-cyclodiphosphate synthase
MRTGGWGHTVSDPAVGLGFDVHAFAPGRALWLGGLLFEDEVGLGGHSDGDVVCHAIADALLGAVALGDVGEHFPDTDPEIVGLAGGELLGRTLRLLADRDRAPVFLDVTVVCERPPIAPRRLEMRDRLASIAGLPVDRVSVKATRPEGLGLTGEGIGCLALAVVT